MRVLLNNIRWSLMDNKFASEQQLRQAGIPFTIVRPGGLTNAPAGEQQLQAGANASLPEQCAFFHQLERPIGRAACAAEGPTRGAQAFAAQLCTSTCRPCFVCHTVCVSVESVAGIDCSLTACCAASCCAMLCCTAEVDAQKESLMGSISRADVAAVCVEALSNPAAKVRAVQGSGCAGPPNVGMLRQNLQAACSPPKCASHAGLWPLHSTAVPAHARR